jgi:hypothetical protein
MKLRHAQYLLRYAWFKKAKQQHRSTAALFNSVLSPLGQPKAVVFCCRDDISEGKKHTTSGSILIIREKY